MSSDVYSYCKLCQINYTQQRKHVYAKKHQKRLKWVLQKYGAKIKECRPYLDNPVIQEGNYEPGKQFWCHCCYKEIDKHVSDHLKTILYGGVLEHLASEEHWQNTDVFFKDNGADDKFKISFIVSEKDINLFKSKLEPLVDKYDKRAEINTNHLAKKIECQEYNRKLVVDSALIESLSSTSQPTIFKTVKNKHGIVQNPTGYHDGVRVWKAGIFKYKQESDQLKSIKYPCHSSRQTPHNRKANSMFTVSAEGGGLTTLNSTFDRRKGNIYTGATPPWLRNDEDGNEGLSSGRQYGPSLEDLKNSVEAKKKSKLNPNRVGANFDQVTNSSKDNENEWLPSFGRVWNNGARWKSRREFRGEMNQSDAKKPRK